MLSLICAMTWGRVIGYHNKMPWHLPGELNYFKTITMGKPIIMGHKTYLSIGKPLPGRRNLVLSRQPHLRIEGCEVYSSLNEALNATIDEPEVIIIGGGMLFQEALPLVERMYLTFIDCEVAGDTFFPEWDEQQWQEISSRNYSADDKNQYAFKTVCLQRRF